MEDGQAIRSSCFRIATIPDGRCNCVRSKRVQVFVKRAPVVYYCGKLSIEGCGYFMVLGECFVVEGDGLVGSSLGTFSGEGFDEGPEARCVVFV